MRALEAMRRCVLVAGVRVRAKRLEKPRGTRRERRCVRRGKMGQRRWRPTVPRAGERAGGERESETRRHWRIRIQDFERALVGERNRWVRHNGALNTARATSRRGGRKSPASTQAFHALCTSTGARRFLVRTKTTQ